MRVDWTLFAIKPSSYISSLCYSIFRIEPYSFCEFKCIYCYARWYRHEKPLVNRLIIKLWRRLAKQLSKTEAPPPFFRLSTLAEPFQGSERVYVLSLDAMKTAYEYEIPLSDANELLNELCEKPTIEKHRFKVPFKGFIWEVDEFHGVNKGLTVAECELESEDQQIQKPDWVGAEVTSDPRYYNSNLIANPYSTW